MDPEVDPETGQLFFRCAEETTANLSRGGAFVRSWEPLAAGRRVIADIDLPDGRRLQLDSRVAWTQRQLRTGEPDDLDATGYGIEFSRASVAQLARLDAILDSLGALARESRSVDAAPGHSVAP